MNFKIDDLARRLIENMPPALRGIQGDLEANFRSVLRANLSKLDLVARDEFLAQTKVLQRAQAQLESLQRRLVDLEARMPAPPKL
ncbi:MAG: accessory factor UbiK family protein [Gammaproteobacteria bacterium]|nr:accessory factor UbiK family protein [Gammaproteobacteria bacterium]